MTAVAQQADDHKAEISKFQQQLYNATVLQIRHVHDSLLILRVRSDNGFSKFQPGQYTTLGLGEWELAPTIEGENLRKKLIRRTYSLSAPLVDRSGSLLTANQADFWEFYIAVVQGSEGGTGGKQLPLGSQRPRLTPLLQKLKPGDRLQAGPRVAGKYTLEGVDRQSDVLFCSTGTGEAPHNAMIAQLLESGHMGQIACVSCVRWERDLAYWDAHQRLQKRFPQYRYIPVTTRESENWHPSGRRLAGRWYLQDLLANGELEDSLPFVLDSSQTQVYLCGNPAMIGGQADPKLARDASPQEIGFADLLRFRGFTLQQARQPGNIHTETYW